MTARKSRIKVQCGRPGLMYSVLYLLLYTAEGSSSFCQIVQADSHKSEASVRVSRSYKGLWLSERCEIHPGPSFLLRRYHIQRSGHFNLVRFHYLDPWCTAASHSVSAVGQLVPSPEKIATSSYSWVVPGGVELDYSLKKVTLVPFNKESAIKFFRKVNGTCAVASQWRPFRKHKVYSNEGQRYRKKKHHFAPVGDIDCLRNLGIYFNELQLMRLEQRSVSSVLRKRLDDRPGETSRRSFLYLGSEGSYPSNRPTYYQVPLVPAQTVHCPVCRVLSTSTAASPPTLVESYNFGHPPSGLEGHWTSLRCEVRPYGLFVRRVFIFGNEEEHWKAQHSYFRDPQCQSPMFVLSATGMYVPGPPSETIPDAFEYDFHVSDAHLTPEDVQFANNLNGLRSCGQFKVGRKSNLSASGGCKELGIVVPLVELDLIRFEIESSEVVLLYLGETMENRQRPTSFQPPLVRCSSDTAEDDDYVLSFNELQPLPLVSGSMSLRLCILPWAIVFLKIELALTAD